MTRERARSLLFLAATLLGVWIAQNVRSRWGLGLGGESLRSWVDGFGWTAPAAYVAVLIFRPFLLLPSMIVLPVGGVVFGTVLGTLLGAAGVVGAALIQFWLAGSVGREAVQRRFGSLLGRARTRIEAGGPIAVALVTAHPTGPMTAFHWGAALAAIPIAPFAAAVLAGALTRSFLYSFFGASLGNGSALQIWIAAGLLLAFFLLPVLHPDVRVRLFGGNGSGGS